MDDSALAQRGRLRQKRMAMACSEAALRLSCPSRWNESELTRLPVPGALGQTIVSFLFFFFSSDSFILSICLPLFLSNHAPLLLRYSEGTTASTMWLLKLFGYGGRPRCSQGQHNDLLQVLVKIRKNAVSVVRLFWIHVYYCRWHVSLLISKILVPAILVIWCFKGLNACMYTIV